jgi:protein-L-isoaspartate(D-aspartate) O-methyltransferase
MGDAVDRRKLDEAFAAVPREDFLPPDQVRFAAVDRALPIGYGQTNSQPTTVRNLLALLDPPPGGRVLDVGCGSGWTTALLAQMVGTDGEVIGVEVVPELVAFGRANLAGQDLPWARIEPASRGVLGLPDQGPYDRVLVSADASRVPGTLVDQLVEGGWLVLPVRGRLVRARRSPGWPDVEPEVTEYGAYAFVPLIEPDV